MKLWSDSWVNGERIPQRFAAGKPDAANGVTFSDNLSPHLAWSEVPAATKSFVLICHDFDVPSRGDDVNQSDREVPADLPRVDFFHWVMVDLPGYARRAEGRRVQPRLHGARQTRPRGRRAARRAPRPERLHRLVRRQRRDGRRVLRLRRPVPAVQRFADPPLRVHGLRPVGRARAGRRALSPAPQVRQAIYPHVLAEATHSGTYTLNRRLL